jgi:hypothetical protein
MHRTLFRSQQNAPDWCILLAMPHRARPVFALPGRVWAAGPIVR